MNPIERLAREAQVNPDADMFLRLLLVWKALTFVATRGTTTIA